jgi:predicted nucleotidyltransferase
LLLHDFCLVSFVDAGRFTHVWPWEQGLFAGQHRASLPPVNALTAGLLETIKQRLVAEFQPEQIWLFGSHAWGTPGDESDLDLMVILPESQERPIRRDQRAQRCLGRLPVSADVLVRTRQEVNRVRDLRGSLTHDVLSRGRKLYG